MHFAGLTTFGSLFSLGKLFSLFSQPAPLCLKCLCFNEFHLRKESVQDAFWEMASNSETSGPFHFLLSDKQSLNND
jgi:hypothetical protein